MKAIVPPRPFGLYTALLCSTTLIAGNLTAQTGGGSETLLQWDGADKGYFGMSVSNAGDINQDGIEDVVVGSPWARPGGTLRTGVVFVYSGADGSQLLQIDGFNDGETFGRAVSAAGDVDGDGIPDLLVGAMWADVNGMHGAGSAYVFSGANGALLYQWDGHSNNSHFGRDLAAAGDLNQDGFDDVLIGERYASPGGLLSAGSAFAFSGADGSVLHQWDGANQHEWFGQSVSGMGDMDGDGVPDVLISADGIVNMAYVYSGASGSFLYQVDDGTMDSDFGGDVSNAGDVDGDGTEDFMVGAKFADHAGVQNSGSAFVYSGANGSLLLQFHGTEPGENLGTTVSNAGDLNGDGHADLLIGSSFDAPPYRGSVFLYSGADASLMFQWDGESVQPQYVSDLSTTGDVNGDGFPEILIGDFYQAQGGALRSGTVRMVSYSPYLFSDTYSVSASAGGSVNLTQAFPSSAGTQDFKVLMSASGIGPSFYGVDIPLTLDSLVLDTFAGIYPHATPTNMHGTLSGLGNATSTISFTSLPQSFVGQSFYLATIAGPSGQLPEYSSAAIRVEVTP